ncbi:TraE/VirB8-like protein [Vibrio ichthyoenteri ATCC 700023]|uniref:TraE/VirB8-like protein n=1 Tax=Vibrio ichthyoenteri ATCC 700023 TaxID=870968 RepID=F9S7I3_9VIBR|nr:type IV secretion system protein [Vibrio ichthyoenteri]EGU31279.1 TraE/VirB8-like protein [Vibrio ichthyoenteri ATCC 700023]
MFWKRKKTDDENQSVELLQPESDLDTLIAESELDESSSSKNKPELKTIENVLDENKHIEKQKMNGSATKAVAEYLKQMQNFESDRVEFIKQQNKFAWRVAIGACLISCLSIGAVISVLPLKTVVPFLVRVDNNTGETDIVNPLSNGQETYEEKLNKFWTQQFVNMRENYYWSTLKDNAARLELLSTDDVFKQYQSYLNGVNSPLNKFKTTRSVKVDIKGTTFLETNGQIFAQTRLTKTVIDNAGLPVALFPVTHWIATSTFDYKKEIKREKEEQINPLGFQITSYHIDPVQD